MIRSEIIGLGHYVPEKVVKNTDLEKVMDTSDAWIQERTGIQQRRFFNPHQDTVANMAAKATRMAAEKAGIDLKEIDFIVFANITPDYFFPGSGVLMQRELGLSNIGALDIRNACSGFIYGLSVADQFIKSGMYKTIVVVGAEIQSSLLELNNEGRSTAVIFGDGAGAAILRASNHPEKGILSTHLHADGNFAEELYVKDPGSSRHTRLNKEIVEDASFKVYMNGNLVFKHAVTRFHEVIHEALQANGLQPSDIDLLIPHQANLRISKYIQEKMNLSDDKVFNNIMYYGNTTAASIPIAMSEALACGKIKENDILCLAAFGSGFTWASAIIKW
jgi:3-oxoacyl-[acyl-carrier-protein] synthase III